MSEQAADPERDVEDFFNEEIFGAKPEEPKQDPFPVDAPPESKPVEEVALEEPTPESEVPGEDTPPEPTPEEPTPEEGREEEVAPEEEELTEDEALAWARKQYGEDLSVDMLAKAAFEKEKLLGKQSEQARVEREERERLEVQARIDALNTPGALTPEEDGWVNEALIANDPGEWAYNALQAERPDLYATILDRWAALGEDESRRARVFHSRVLQLVSTPQPSEQESYAAALGTTFSSLGLDIDTHGPLILAKAEELGAAHPAVQGMMSSDADVRRIATRAVFDLVSAANTTVAKAKTEDVVEQRVQEESLRRQAAGVEQGGTRVEQPKRSPFWEEFDQELAERGWDGNRPTYGRDE